MERTLCLIKPNAVAANNAGAILKMIQEAGLKVLGMKMLQLTKAQAEAFYAVHNERPFFGSLCDFMISGPIVAVALEGDDAIVRYRTLMGATNPAEADEGTIRKLYADDLEANAVHGSDSPENAVIEVNFFFNEMEIVG